MGTRMCRWPPAHPCTGLTGREGEVKQAGWGGRGAVGDHPKSQLAGSFGRNEHRPLAVLEGRHEARAARSHRAPRALACFVSSPFYSKGYSRLQRLIIRQY